MKKFFRPLIFLIPISMISALICAQSNTFPTTGNVGIGTTTPTAPLQVSGTANDLITVISNTTSRGGIYVQNTNAGAQSVICTDNNRGAFASYCGFLTGSSSSTLPNLFGLSRADRSFIFADGVSNLGLGVGTLTAQPVVFATSNTERMRLDASGNFGIGISSPIIPLHVVGHLAATEYASGALSGFTELWNDQAIIWKSGNPSNDCLRFGSATDLTAGSWSEKMRINNAGNLGIGEIPNHRLTIFTGSQGDGLWMDGTGGLAVALLGNETQGAWNSLSQPGDNLLLWKGTTVDNPGAGGLVIGPWSSSTTGIRITSSGNVGIGEAAPQSLLAVKGTITSQKVVVTLTGWADYVFKPNYRLLPLSDLQKYIRINQHLPEMPSASEIETKGEDIGANQAALLKKVEELTLYILEQDKKIKVQQKRLDQLARKVEKLVK